MPTTLHGWTCQTKGCPRQGIPTFGRCKPPKSGQWVYRAYSCKACKRPMQGNGQTHKKYSLAELL